MRNPTTLALVALIWRASASQPGAPLPVASPKRDLRWGQINFLHTTDTHGWHGGHLQEAAYSADWGDYVSFASHLRAQADEKGVDLLLIDTGDRIEGNGLYDASSPKGVYTSQVLRTQDIDVICTGNHELYKASSVRREHDVTVPDFGDRYLASNLDYVDPDTGEQVPQARRYRKFNTRNQNLTVVAFGFLLDFDRGANNSVVQHVADMLKKEWFQQAIREKPDLFVVIGHVGLRMKESELIFAAIRDQNWHTPIVFFGGHLHIRDARRFDDKAAGIASGRYFETIGWMAVDGVEKRENIEETQAFFSSSPSPVSAASSAVEFHRRYIDANLLSMYHHTGLNSSTFPTASGLAVSNLIASSRQQLDLDETYGCAPRSYWLNRAAYPGPDSLLSLLQDRIIPETVVSPSRAHVPRLLVSNTGMMRFDVFEGKFTVDTIFIVSPFVNRWRFIRDVPFEVAKKVTPLINSGGNVFAAGMGTAMPGTGLLSIEQMAFRTTAAPSSLEQETEGHGIEVGDQQQRPLRARDQTAQHRTPGYTTHDDFGDDGDDTPHEALTFYQVPNVIESRVGFSSDNAAAEEDGGSSASPETVDLVFVDYVQPWILLALKFAGGDYNVGDVGLYSHLTTPEMLERWVRENWRGNC